MVLTEQHGLSKKRFKMKKIPVSVQKIWKKACLAQKKAHAPYSRFRVGAALEAGKEIYSGCNIENASFGATLCAERVALAKAVSEGKKNFQNIVVVTRTKKGVPPCALCLQMMAELCTP